MKLQEGIGISKENLAEKKESPIFGMVAIKLVDGLGFGGKGASVGVSRKSLGIDSQRNSHRAKLKELR